MGGARLRLWSLLPILLLFLQAHFTTATPHDPTRISDEPFTVTYQLKTIHTLGRHSHRVGSMHQVQAARVRIDWNPSFNRLNAKQIESIQMRLKCHHHTTFETQPDELMTMSTQSKFPSKFLLSADAHAVGKESARKLFNIVQRMSFIHTQPPPPSGTPSTIAYVLLHQLPTRALVNEAIRSNPATPSTEFGGWPQPVKPCRAANNSLIDASEDDVLACCHMEVGWMDEASGEIQVARAPMKPLIPVVHNREDTSSVPFKPTIPLTSQHHDDDSNMDEAHRNSTSILLEWRRALHGLSSSTPLSPVTAPSHLPPTIGQRKEFLRAALRRAALIESNKASSAIPPSVGSTRLRRSDLPSDDPVREEVVSFVERSGWSSTSLQDLMDGNVEPGMSPRTLAIISPTAEDEAHIGSLMTDVTTTFLQAMEQVKTHLRAGVGAKQIIAMVCNKLVLRDMPPKVGLAIVKALQQPVLNILKETISDQLTEYLVPPGSVGAFVEQHSSMRPSTEHSMMSKTIAMVDSVNPLVANELREIENKRIARRMDEWTEKETRRREQMEQPLFLETEATVDMDTNAQSVPLSATIEFPDPPSSHRSSFSSSHNFDPDSDDKYSSFLSTYSASRLRHRARLGVGTSGDAIGERLKDYLGPMLTHGIIHDASAQTQNVLHVLLHESLSNKLHEDISKSLIESLTKSLTDSISESQVALLSVSLRAQLTRELTHHLTKSLTLLLTPALTLVLTRSLTRSPHDDYYCHICANPVEMPEKPAEFHLDPPEGADPEKPYCLSCEHSKENEYYQDYYGAYYARYYSSYFSYYYGSHYSRLFHEQTLGTCKTQPCQHAL